MKKENVGKLKVLTLIGGFVLGVVAIIFAYILAEVIDSNLNVVESIKSAGILVFIKNMMLSGLVVSGTVYLIAEIFYKLHIFSKNGDVKSELKFFIIEFIKGIIVFVLLMAINIEIELVGVLYASFILVILILYIIVCCTRWCVKNFNDRLEERRKKKE